MRGFGNTLVGYFMLSGFLIVTSSLFIRGEDDFDEFEEVDQSAIKKTDPMKSIPSDFDESLIVNVDADSRNPLDSTLESRFNGFFYWEGLALIFLVLYAIIYFTGKKRNEDIARKWTDHFHSFLSAQFSKTGLTGENNENDTLIKCSDNNYRYYCSGRRYCTGMLSDIQMLKRNDLFAVLYNLVFPSRDYLVIEVGMNATDIEPFVLCLSKKSSLVSLRSSIPELDMTTKVSLIEDIPESISVLADVHEVVQPLLTRLVKKTIVEHEDFFDYMIFTDQNLRPIMGFDKLHTHFLRCRFVLPPMGEMNKMDALLEMTVYFIDALATRVSLTKEGRIKSEKKRKEKLKQLDESRRDLRKELSEQKRSEKLRKQREEYESLSYEQQQRRDEQQQKKLARKRGSRMKR